jgi:hypothetical protein
VTDADRASTDDLGGEVKLGSMLFTLVEPHKGHEVAYNRWYERDHFYAGCMVGPWLFAGRRWVATRALKDLRTGTRPDLFGPDGVGSYLAVYWVLDGRHDDHFDWGLRQVKWLHANDRMFPERDHIHTLLYRFEGGAPSSNDGVPPELALDHPYRGLVATITEGEGPTGLAFSPVPLAADAPVTQQGLDGLERRTMTLTFLDHEPTAADMPTADNVLWSAAFIPTIPGTDTYTDQLW